MHSARPATLGRIRLYVIGTALLAFLLSWGMATSQQVGQVEDSRLACEGANRQRAVELAQQDALILNARARAADPTSQVEGRAALGRALRIRKELVAAVPTKEAPDSIRRDCEAAYGKPFPWSLFG